MNMTVTEFVVPPNLFDDARDRPNVEERTYRASRN